jgi:DtxR family Mn-dependent transcriptional regulator
MSSGNREDYLISILRITEGQRSAKTTELANFMNVSPASVTEMVKILANEGYVKYERYRGVILTPAGLNYARRIRKKHHVVESFLTDVLDVDHMAAHEEACRIEHAISEESALKMCEMLGYPVDKDCNGCMAPCKASTIGRPDVETLDMIKEGCGGKISYLKSSDSAVVKKLISWGFIPGKTLMVQVSNPKKTEIVVLINGDAVAIDRNIATCIFLEPI